MTVLWCFCRSRSKLLLFPTTGGTMRYWLSVGSLSQICLWQRNSKSCGRFGKKSEHFCYYCRRHCCSFYSVASTILRNSRQVGPRFYSEMSRARDSCVALSGGGEPPEVARAYSEHEVVQASGPRSPADSRSALIGAQLCKTTRSETQHNTDGAARSRRTPATCKDVEEHPACRRRRQLRSSARLGERDGEARRRRWR